MSAVLTLERQLMWSIDTPSSGITNKATVPEDGFISIVKPKGVKVSAFVNDMPAPIHHVHVKAGDVVHFELKSNTDIPASVSLEYAGNKDLIEVAASNKTKTEEDIMTGSEAINLFANPNRDGMGGALGGGLGAGLVGGLLGTALFGRRGLGGEVDGGGIPATLQGVESVVNNSAIMQSLGDIKAAIPLAESQAQLALAGAQMDLNNSITQGTASVIGSISGFQSTVMNNLNMQTQMNQKGFADTTAAVVAQGNANMLATKDASVLAERNSWAITQAIANDGDKTRALIQSIDKSNDSRTITNLANEVTELRHEGRLRGVEGNITISNNNTANAVAQQQQAQQQQQQIATLLATVNALYAQNQHIQQGVLNIGSGTVSGNSQGAANTRVS